MDASKIRNDFPVLQKHPKLIYFDNACTTLKPKSVIDAINSYYSDYSACAGRSNHSLSRQTDEAFTSARETVAKFIKASPENIAWMRNTTEGINTVAEGMDFSKRKKVVISNLEHHSLLLPFLRLHNEGKIRLEFAMASQSGEFSEDAFSSQIDSGTALVAVHYTTNTTGAKAPLEKITKCAHDAGAMVLIDGAQGVPHSPVDFGRLGADFLAFSAHKMCGPTGIGALCGKSDALSSLRTHNIGGETISTATLSSYSPLPVPKRFEAGIQHYAGAIGFAAACKYLSSIGMENVAAHEKKLAASLQNTLQNEKSLEGKLAIYGPPSPSSRSSALLAFNLNGISAHQVSISLDKLSSIAVRSGLFCAQPAMEHMGAKNGAVRASLYIYNTQDEIVKFASALSEIAKLC